jgi:hypothetical protein
MEMSGQRHAPAALFPWERITGAHWVGCCVGFGAGLDTEVREEILCWGSNPGRPVCSQTLYWLSYPSRVVDIDVGQRSEPTLRESLSVCT